MIRMTEDPIGDLQAQVKMWGQVWCLERAEMERYRREVARLNEKLNMIRERLGEDVWDMATREVAT